MNGTLAIARDLIREAASRRWFIALAGAITLFLGSVTVGLNMEVVDGALAATRFFGEYVQADVQAADVALRPIFQATSYVIFYGGIAFGIVACSDFGPSLLAPGRIEHLLSLPIRRASLLAGTMLGVWLVIACGAMYGALGVMVILGLKTGVWTPELLLCGALASVTFIAIYGVMLMAAVFVRSAAISASVGLAVFVAGIISGYRESVGPLFSEEGVWRSLFRASTTFMPPISSIADAAAAFAASHTVDVAVLSRQLAGTAIYGVAALAIAIWKIEQVDF